MDHTNEELDRQAPKAFGGRIRTRAAEIGLGMAELGRLAGVKKQSMSGYWNGERLCGSDKLFTLSDALRVNARWLISGEGAKTGGDLMAVEDADWVHVDEFDIRELTDVDRGPVVSTTPFRKDWLNRTIGQSSGIWLARLPADLPRYDLREGELVFVRDVQDGEAQDGAIYIVRILGRLTAARLDALQDAQRAGVENSLADRSLAFRHLGREDGQAILVARVLGVPLKRL